MAKDKSKCSGCRNNFYNGNNSLGVSECWSLADAKLKTRYRLPRNVPVNKKGAYVKVRVYNCYHETGYAYFDSIPNYAK